MSAVRYPLDEDPVPRILIHALGSLPDPEQRAEQVHAWVRRLDGLDAPEWRRLLADLGSGHPPGPNLLQNPHLSEIATGEQKAPDAPASWQNTFHPLPALRARITSEAARNGPAGITVTGASVWQIAQPVPVESGAGYTFSAWVSGTVAPSSRIAMRVRWYDAGGTPLRHSRTDRLPPDDHPGWRRITIVDRAPDNAVYALPIFSVEYQDRGDIIHATDFTFEETARAGADATPR